MPRLACEDSIQAQNCYALHSQEVVFSMDACCRLLSSTMRVSAIANVYGSVDSLVRFNYGFGWMAVTAPVGAAAHFAGHRATGDVYIHAHANCWTH
jgi:hypothetical protein